MANADDENDEDLRPLTRRQKDGTLFFRAPEVVEELRRVLQRPVDDLVAKKRTVSSAVLVYVMRHLRPPRETKWFIELWEELRRRVSYMAYKQAEGLSPQRARDVSQAVCDWFREELFSGTDKADVFEACFKKVIILRTLDEIRKVRRRDQIEKNDVEFQNDDGSYRDLVDAINLRNIGRSMPRGEAAAQLNRILSQLTPRERDAVLAVHGEGLAESSSDPNEITASSKLGISDRRIRKLLANAEKRASANEEE
ncbi:MULTISPECIES: sigma-70 family RNA polymerase sigma factor [unclassified Ensifer]|uniref:sigma-70 family RNA polymerase sigma factor n=1 Tax=unclassified Ensifer TaxID=2633371 RepID=UPI0007138A09|nr:MULTISPECIES: sigma-70 family RNA polymerase sigma factor [unclassified Ensifer]KQX43208.1 hypothetical protein ASD49_11145 [Ensifer sp. Root1298]KQX72757.1 hypothetical protein ASD41_11645 [Ensifer sp. Root1312]KRC15723.1 hypothetical protein ASE29_11200 [Ensifer sp. Root74]KRD58998.1 hypothetical protein ASE71_09275 [Ensifer sp. Root954]